MFRCKLGKKSLLSFVLLSMLFPGVSTAWSQTARRTRRESNANRKARIQREIQETYGHRYEVAGGGGYLRFRSGQNLQKNNEVTFFLNGAYLLNPKLGILADIHGAFGKAKIGNGTAGGFDPGFNIPNPQISQYTFSGGPLYRLYAGQRTSVSVFGTGGIAVGKFDSGSKAIPAVDLGIYNSSIAPVFTAGVNFDYNFYPNLSARITPTYIGTVFSSTVQNNVGFNIGIVYRFGRTQ